MRGGFRTAIVMTVLALAPQAVGATPAPIILHLAPSSAAVNTEIVASGQTGRVVRNVTDPTLEVYLPEKKASDAAVIIMPGGGFMMLSYDSEGVMVARWLAAHGVAAFVLKYRLEPTPVDQVAFMGRLGAMLQRVPHQLGPAGLPPVFPSEAQAAEDATAALRLVRKRSAEWGIDPGKVGLLGFSAGGIATTDVATGPTQGRPDFIGVIYAGVRSPVPAAAPPAFFAGAADDPLLPDAAIKGFLAWRAAGRPAELHVYERGGHGFGLIPKGTSSDSWLIEFLWWMRARGLVQPNP